MPSTSARFPALVLSLACLAFAALAHQPASTPRPADGGAVAEAPEPPEEGHGTPGEENDDKDKDKWDVNDPPGETYEVTIDTTSGTWLSLDVSPDGREVVFDLLGDLYTVPITGGDATALTSGLAWDMQPRYSPDGRSIAFTSDRGGGDNIWVMGRDGSDPQAVTKEDFRLLNSPAWSPDGEWIAARKHFTARRSLGAGEIWLYHRSGGEGLEMTEKPNDQKDVGEPTFSPDGRYVYFSQDTTPGDVFEYNKDPNGEIYTIRRLDRRTGRIDDFLTGPGGAVRPTPSPDGRWLAFVRRVRGRSTLFLHDLATDANRPLYDALDRDMQETWAIHGVYPAMAWTPDSAAIVFWAGGKIHRLEIGTGEVADIPFRVRQTHRLFHTVRFPVEVAPPTFDVKMLRWVEVSPDGRRVVYEALGKLWVKELPAGAPHRVTTQDDHFELYPSWSRDGRSLVYVSWDDEALGAVRIVPVGGGKTPVAGRVVTPEPGHYLEPALSPDGATVVYRKVAGGFITSPLYSHDPGVYRIPAAGGEPVRIALQGVRPHFGAASDRVFLTVSAGRERRELRSLPLTGLADADEDVRAPYASEAATEMRVSPDGRWLAFAERFKVYVTPFVETGKTVDIGPKTKSIPVRLAAEDSGSYLHWSGDSRSLHWALGPALYSRSLTDTFAFLEGAPEELPEPTSEGMPIGFKAPQDVPQGTVALVGGRLVTMRGDEVVERGTVVVRGDRIVAVGPADRVAVPAGALEIDVSGKTVLPGIIDVHWHGAQGVNEIVPEQDWYDYSSLAFGVTTIHDPSNDTSTFFAASQMARSGAIVAPRLFSTGTILYGAASDFKAIIDDLDDARFHLKRMQAVGAFSVKSYNQPRRDQRQQVLAAARELGMMVVPEGGSLFEHNMTMVVDGHTGVEHALPVARVYDDVVQLWSQSDVGYTPTLVVAYGGLWGERYWYAKTNVWEDERLLAFTPRERVDPIARRPVLAPPEEYNHIAVSRAVHQLRDAGVHVQLGAHGQREGLGAHWELWMLGQGGMAPHEALRVATLGGAEYLGLEGDLGSLEVGKLADLIVLDENPVEDLRHSESVRYTMVGGRLYDARTMDEVGLRPRPRRRFFFEQE